MPFPVNSRIQVNYTQHPLHGKTGRVIDHHGSLHEVQLDDFGRRSIVLPEAVLAASTSVSKVVYDNRPHVHGVACQLAIGNCAIPEPVEDEEDAESSSSVSSSSSMGA